MAVSCFLQVIYIFTGIMESTPDSGIETLRAFLQQPDDSATETVVIVTGTQYQSNR